MCKVDGGTFSLGEPAAKAWGARRMTVQSFYIDQFEVTAAQAARFLNAVGTNECVGYGDENHRDCVIDIDNGRLDLIRRTDRFRVQPGSEERAAVFSVEGALRYCAWVGKLVPSEAQWEYAARHDPRIRKDYLYAWGNRWDPDRAYLPDDKNGPFLPGGSMPVGSFDGTGGRPDGSSPWGLHDIVGNVSEHAVRCADPDEGCGIGCICPSVSRGLTIAPELTSRSTETTPGVSPNWGGFRGLRCVRPGPEP
jgi:formylglycine-generating enzyme required for sulfatase activity